MLDGGEQCLCIDMNMGLAPGKQWIQLAYVSWTPSNAIALLYIIATNRRTDGIIYLIDSRFEWYFHDSA